MRFLLILTFFLCSAQIAKAESRKGFVPSFASRQREVTVPKVRKKGSNRYTKICNRNGCRVVPYKSRQKLIIRKTRRRNKR